MLNKLFIITIIIIIIIKNVNDEEIYDLLYLYKVHLIEVNVNSGGRMTIDARWRFIPIKIDLSQRNEISYNSIEYFMGGANIRYSRKII